ncbi:MAG: hypothetical protein QXE05_02030 [Nitrososphaeria archaeon]
MLFVRPRKIEVEVDFVNTFSVVYISFRRKKIVEAALILFSMLIGR